MLKLFASCAPCRMLRVAKNTEMPGMSVYSTKTNVALGWKIQPLFFSSSCACKQGTGMLKKFSKFCWTLVFQIFHFATCPVGGLEEWTQITARIPRTCSNADFKMLASSSASTTFFGACMITRTPTKAAKGNSSEKHTCKPTKGSNCSPFRVFWGQRPCVVPWAGRLCWRRNGPQPQRSAAATRPAN